MVLAHFHQQSPIADKIVPCFAWRRYPRFCNVQLYNLENTFWAFLCCTESFFINLQSQKTICNSVFTCLQSGGSLFNCFLSRSTWPVFMNLSMLWHLWPLPSPAAIVHDTHMFFWTGCALSCTWPSNPLYCCCLYCCRALECGDQLFFVLFHGPNCY